MKSGTFGRLILCASFLYSFCSYGDVFKARVGSTDITVTKRKEATSETDPNAQQFVDFINGVGNFAEGRSFDKQCNNETWFPSLSAKERTSRKNWEMPGCAVFVPESMALGVSCPVYIAQKRPYADSAYLDDNNPDEHDVVVNPTTKETTHIKENEKRLFHYTSNMHTERQLIITALEDASLKNVNANSLPTAINTGALVPWNQSQVDLCWKDLQELKGDLYVYTKSAPCRKRTEDAGCISCVEYYFHIAQKFPGVRFHIYFLSIDDILVNKSHLGGKYLKNTLNILSAAESDSPIKTFIKLQRGTTQLMELSDVEEIDFKGAIWGRTTQINKELTLDAEKNFNLIYSFKTTPNLHFYFMKR